MNDFTNFDDQTLAALLKAEKNTAAKAFGVLYKRYGEKLNVYCSFIAPTSEDAKDLFQDTWIKFHKTAVNSKSQVKLPVFLYTIARTLNIDKYRVKKNNYGFEPADIDFDEIPDLFNLNKSIDNKDLMNMLNIALSSLSDKLRETFVLNRISGLTIREIAQITGESLDCIKQRNARAMDELIKILKPVIDEVKERG